MRPIRTITLEMGRAAGSLRYLLVALVAPLALYLLYPLTGVTGDDAERLIGGVTWPTHFMVSMAAFGTIGGAISIGAGLVRAANHRSPRPVSWAARRPSRTVVLVRMGMAAILALPPLALVGLAGVVVNDVRLPAVAWVELGLLLSLGALPFSALGLLLGSTLEADTIDVVIVALVVMLAILGGLFQPLDTLPGVIAAAAHVLPSVRLANLGWATIATNRPDPVDILALAGYVVAIGALVAWRYRGED